MQIYSPITPKNKIKKKAHTPQISQDKPEQLSIVAPNVRIKTWGRWRWLRVLIGKAGRRGGGRLGGRQTRHDGRPAAVSGEHRGRGHGLCDADAACSCFFAEDGKSTYGNGKFWSGYVVEDMLLSRTGMLTLPARFLVTGQVPA